MEVAVGGSLLGSISEFCRRTGMAESTFGRRAVNDGKFVARLRDGARVTPETLQRVNQFMVEARRRRARAMSPPELLPLIRASALAADAGAAAARGAAGKELPLLRQPAEVPAVRQHLQREGRGGEARRASSSATSIRGRRRCACSTPAWATARCSRA